jgi:hypothetical protein
MGIGMQIAYLGFAGAARIEAEAGVQLLRLMRFARQVSACHLAVEAVHEPGAIQYDARLDIVTPAKEFIAIEHCSDADPEAAVRAAFDRAVLELTRRSSEASHPSE